MQIAAHILAYNVDRFIVSAIQNAAPHVERIYVAYPSRPFGYIPSSRETKRNPTSIERIREAGFADKVEIVEGDWLNEESMRNACLDRARAAGFDWFLTQDADEFYEDRTWRQIRAALERNYSAEHFVTTWYNFWKSSQYVLVHRETGIKETNAGFALRCRDDLKFVNRRLTNATASRVLDCPCYHYGYVMADAEMREKLITWSHSHEVNADRWYRLKWQQWRESSRNLHPTYPRSWSRAIRFPLSQPDFADQFNLAISPPPPFAIADQLDEMVGDARLAFRECARSLKRRLTNARGQLIHVGP